MSHTITRLYDHIVQAVRRAEEARGIEQQPLGATLASVWERLEELTG